MQLIILIELFFYFARLPHLWNAMPAIGINQSLSPIKYVQTQTIAIRGIISWII